MGKNEKSEAERFRELQEKEKAKIKKTSPAPAPPTTLREKVFKEFEGIPKLADKTKQDINMTLLDAKYSASYKSDATSDLLAELLTNYKACYDRAFKILDQEEASRREVFASNIKKTSDQEKVYKFMLLEKALSTLAEEELYNYLSAKSQQDVFYDFLEVYKATITNALGIEHASKLYEVIEFDESTLEDVQSIRSYLTPLHQDNKNIYLFSGGRIDTILSIGSIVNWDFTSMNDAQYRLDRE